MIRPNKFIFCSITKGLIIAGLLVFFHVLASHNDSYRAKAESFKVAATQPVPIPEGNESKFLMASCSLNVAMNFEIIREMLVLLIVVFNINAAIKIFSFVLPIPLGENFKTLFSSVISPNAP
jgi:hypothetical protein